MGCLSLSLSLSLCLSVCLSVYIYIYTYHGCSRSFGRPYKFVCGDLALKDFYRHDFIAVFSSEPCVQLLLGFTACL